jgi:hypothetical protein
MNFIEIHSPNIKTSANSLLYQLQNIIKQKSRLLGTFYYFKLAKLCSIVAIFAKASASFLRSLSIT